MNFPLFRRLSLILSGIAVMIMALSACHKSDKRLYPYGWSLTDPAFDSITRQLERGFLDMAPDSVLNTLIYRMEKLAADKSAPEKNARFHYWHARMRLRHGDVDGAMKEFNQSIALTDSARHPYDIARIRWNMDLSEPETVDDYFATIETLDLFKKFNDIPMQAAYTMTLGSMMVEVGDSQAGLRYFNTADSLLGLCDLRQQQAGLAISRARCLEKTEGEAAAAEVLRNALKDSIFCREPIAVGIAHWNLYLYTDSLNYLRLAYQDLDNDINADSMRPLYGAHLIKEYAKRGMTDSISAMIPIVDADSANLEYDNQWRDFYLGRAAGEQALGHHEEANKFYTRAAVVIEKILEDTTPDKVISLDVRRQIDEKIHRLEIQRKDRTLWLLAALAATALLAAVVILLYHRRLSNKQKEKLKAEMAEKQALRKVLALELAMEENRRMDEDFRDTVGSLEKEGRMDASASEVLKATLKSRRVNHPAQESFVSTFADVSPEFLAALEANYPSLTKTDRRLAVYIYLGLDTKHISRLTGTRPESVKQARWRLRSKMGLAENESLEEAIRALDKDS